MRDQIPAMTFYWMEICSNPFNEECVSNHPIKASILQRITYQQRTPPLFLQREKRCHVSAANL